MKRSMISLLVVGMLSGNAMAATFTLKSGSTLTEEQANTIISNFYSDTSTENFLAIKNNFNIPDEYASSALSFYNQYARVYQSTVEKFSNLFEKPVVVVDTHAPAADVHLGSSGDTDTSSGNTGSTEVVMPDGLTEHKETGVITQKDIDDKQTAAIQNVTRGIVAVDGKVEDLEKHVETIDGAVKDNTDAIHQLGDTVTSHIDDSNQRITSIENDVNTKASQAEVDTLTHTVETNKQELTAAIDTKADQSAVDHSVDSLMVRNSLLHKKVGSLLNGQAETLTEVEQLRSDTSDAIQALTAQVVVNTGTIHGVPEASKESFEYAHSVLGDAQAALGSILAGKNVGQVEAPSPVNPSGAGGLTVSSASTIPSPTWSSGESAYVLKHNTIEGFKAVDSTTSSLMATTMALKSSIDGKVDKQYVDSADSLLQRQISANAQNLLLVPSEFKIGEMITHQSAIDNNARKIGDDNLQVQVTANKNDIDDLNTKVANIAGVDKTYVDTSDAKLQTQLNAKADQSTVNLIQNHLEVRIASAENAAKLADSKLEDRIVPVEIASSIAKANAQKALDKVTDVETVANNALSKATTNENTINSLGMDLNQAKAAINKDITAEITARKDADTAIKADVAQNAKDITSVKTSQSQLATQISSNAGDIATNKQSIDTVNSNVARVETDYKAADSKIQIQVNANKATADDAKRVAEGIAATASDAHDKATTAMSKADTAASEVSSMKTTVSTFDDRINANHTSIKNNQYETNSKFAQVENTLNNHEQRITGLEKGFEQQVKEQNEKIAANDKKAMSGVASAMAMSSMQYTGNINSMAFAIGKYDSGTGIGVGYRHKLSDNAQANIQATYDDSKNVGVSAGVAFGW